MSVDEQLPALAGLLVLDFTRVVAGPYLTQMLGDLGAEIIKIEAPGAGDDARHFRPQGWTRDAPGFVGLNRHKKSVEIDIKSGPGQQLCRELAAKADVLVENFRPDVMARFGLDYETLSQVNPQLIYVSVSGYGHTGPNRLVAGYDPIAQAESGLMYLTGDPAGEPQKAGGSVGDTITGLHAGMGLLAALHARERTGQGQFVDVSLFDSLVSVLGYLTAIGNMTGDPVPRMGNRSFLMVPLGVYRCADGLISLVVGNDRQFKRFCVEALQRPDLFEDARFATIASRLENRDVLESTLEEILTDRGQDEWVERMRAAGVPAGAVRDPVSAWRSPEAVARNMSREVEFDGESVEVVNTPFHLSGTPLREGGQVPLLGQHTVEVMRTVLGRDEREIQRLAEAGAFGPVKHGGQGA